MTASPVPSRPREIVRRPRALVHRGRVRAAGLIVAPVAADERGTRARVLAEWDPGTRVFRLGAGYVLLFAAPRTFDAAVAPGTPLIERGGRLLGLPLDPDELETFAPPPRALLMAVGGRVELRALDDAPLVDPSEWLDLAGFEAIEVATLGRVAPAKPVELIAPNVELRARLAEVPPPHEEAASLVAAILGVSSSRSARGRGAPEVSAERPSPGRFWMGIRSSLARWFSKLGPNRQGPQPAELEPRSGIGRLMDWLSRLGTQALLRTQLASLLGKKHAKYLEELFSSLDEGDDDEALRAAIPLASARELQNAIPTLGLPERRTSFELLSARAGGPPRVVPYGPGVFERLRARYRALFERLDRAGRVQEAAFVLAELLQEQVEAVGYLERHGHLRLAAELAEARVLAPALMVRQWVLAKDLERAVRIARRHGVFAEAIALLRAKHPEAAASLRLMWADSLAEAGEFILAVEAIWPLPDARPLAVAWIERALEVGGVSSARMLGHALEVLPGRFEDWRVRALELLEDTSHGAAMSRRVFAETLRTSVSPQVRTISRATIRALVADASRRDPMTDAALLNALIRTSADSALKADLPPLPNRDRAFAETVETIELSVARSDRGNVAIRSAAALPKGRFLVALGEAGVALLGRDGRSLAHFGEPADALAVSDHGHRAIAIYSTGTRQRLSRIDLVHRRAGFWTEAELDAWTTDFDGWRWFVSSPDEGLMALDPTVRGLDAIWRNSGCKAIRLARGSGALGALAADAEGYIHDAWSFEVPSGVCRARSFVGNHRWPAEGAEATGVSPLGEVWELVPGQRSGDLEDTLRAWSAVPRAGEHAQSFSIPLPSEVSVHSVIHRPPWMAISAESEFGARVLVVNTAQRLCRTEINLVGGARPGTRIHDQGLVVWDDAGRLVHVDLRTGRVVCSLRVRI